MFFLLKQEIPIAPLENIQILPLKQFEKSNIGTDLQKFFWSCKIDNTDF